jgi:iron complex outermembrane recepter protein
MSKRLTLIASAVASALVASHPARAQQAPATDVKKGEQITVTASPLGRAESELAQPATVLTEEDLRRKRAASIGDTLSQEIGVQSSAFGPAAGRPIIRGLDGPRIRVLENGIGTLDVSSVSPDHMVTTESLHAEQIEILRGPASLLYGSGAIGGVVNVVSNLIPRAPAAAAFGGNAELRYGTANREKTGAVNLDGGADAIAWHLDGFSRKSTDYRIPGHAVVDDPESPSGRLPDTQIDAKGFGGGASWVGSRGYLGAGVEHLENVYGVPTGEHSHIELHQTNTTVAGELADPLPMFSKIRFRAGHNDYQHQEVAQNGDVATTFKNKAEEGRVELTHAPFGGVTGTWGVQIQSSDMSALGEEALFPKTKSRNTGFFVVEQKDFGRLTADAGLRFERDTRTPTVDAENADKFGAAVDRSFNLVTPAVGLVWKLGNDHRLAINATQAQRAPTTEELYSNGNHGATSTNELGNPQLRKEVSRNLDVSLRKINGDVRWKVNLFYNRIKDYVYAASADANGDGVADHVNDAGELDLAGAFLVINYSQADARFHGAEAELSWKPEGSPFGVRLFGDTVRASLSDGSNLPRMSPSRLGMDLDARRGPWSGRLTAIHAFEAKHLAPLETPTGDYTRLDAEIAWQVETAKGRGLTLFLQGSNLTDEEIRLHTSYLKDVAPLMGRSFTIGVRAEF